MNIYVEKGALVYLKRHLNVYSAYITIFFNFMLL